MNFDELKQRIGQVTFDTSNTNGDGFETDVVFHDDLDFVMKLSKHPLDGDAYRFIRDGYKTSIDYLGGLIAKTSIVKDLPLTIGDKTVDCGEAFIQERVTIADEYLDDLVAKSDEAGMQDLGRQIAELDNGILARGCYVSDNYLRNCGITSDGQVVLFDLGDVTRDIKSVLHVIDPCFRPHEPKGEAQRLNKRGHVIYERSGLLGQHSAAAKAAYEEALGLTFDPEVDIYKFTMRDIVELSDTIGACVERVWDMPPAYQNNKSQYLAAILRAKEPFGQFQVVYSSLIRNKYAAEFQAIAEEEVEKHFDPKGQGQPTIAMVG